MATVNMLEAKTSLSRLVDAIERGAEHEVIIARNGRPAAKLVAYQPPATGQRLGVVKGRFAVPDNIDAANEQVAALFGLS